MKKILSLVLLLITLLGCMATFSSCQARLKEVRLEKNIEEVALSYEDGNTHARIYLAMQEEDYDVADLFDVVALVSYKKKPTQLTTTSERLKATVPEGARGNPDLQYIEVVIKGHEIPPEQFYGVDIIEAYINPKTVGQDVEKSSSGRGAVNFFKGCGVALLLLVIDAIIFIIGYNLAEDAAVLYLLFIPLIVNILFIIAAFKLYGAVVGIPLIVSTLIFLVGSICFVRYME